MASGSQLEVRAEPEKLPLEIRKEIDRLRGIMYEPSCVRLSTRADDDGRYLTDGYVMLDVTDSPAVDGVEDGRYRLMAPPNQRFKPLDGPNEFDADGYFARLADAEWAPAEPSQWSVAEHPGKAMLFSVETHSLPGDPLGDVVGTEPALMGEETWRTLRRHYEDANAEYAVSGVDLNIFRILSGDLVIAYVAGIQIPTGQEGIAQAIAELNQVASSTSNHEEVA